MILEASRPTYWGGSGGADAPPGIKLGFVFSQPRANMAAFSFTLAVSRKQYPAVSRECQAQV